MLDWETLQADKTLACKNYTPYSIQRLQYTTIHHTAMVNGSLDAVLNAFNANGTSAHYGVDNAGTIAQYVNDWDIAWACGNWDANSRSISIEHMNDSSNPWTVGALALEEGAHLVGAIHHMYKLNRPTWLVNVFPHSHFAATACPGELASSQNALYMERAQYWYDVMERGTYEQQATTAIPEVEGAVYRMYYPESGQHFFTASHDEAQYLANIGVLYEGIAWHTGKGGAVLRLYNPNTGEHLLTTSHAEHDECIRAGWTCEGIGFQSGSSVPVYRLYSPAGLHHYTASEAELLSLVDSGWKNEGAVFTAN